jgi:hypothetical protein
MDFYIYLCFSALWMLIGLLVGYKWHAWEVAHLEQCQAEREVEQRASEPAPLSPKVQREIATILDGDDYEWVWRDAI